MRKGKLKSTVTFIAGLFLIAFGVQALSFAKGDSLVFPGIFEILKSFFQLLSIPRTYQLILTTLTHLFVSLFFSSLLGTFIGLFEGRYDFIYRLLRPLMTLLRSIPIIVLVVIIMVLTEYEKVPYIASVLVLVPLISEATSEGLRRIRKEQSELIEAYRLFSSFSPRILVSVYIPLMAGYLRQAYTNAVGMGIKIIVTTEYLVQTKNSLGKAVNTSIYFNEYSEIYAWALIMILLVLLTTEIPRLVKIAVDKVIRHATR
ncbi:MAG: ABC transporter permease subunit [Treponema sp.]|nr:ABC transporter permease subunit [Treponema sp.]